MPPKKSMIIVLIVAGVLLLILILAGVWIIDVGPGGIDLGNSRSGFASAPQRVQINVEKAIELAAPYLDDSYRLRKEMRGNGPVVSGREAVVWATFSKDWYYITKDDYPSYTPGYYTRHAVKVNAMTGEVVVPE